MKKIMFAATLFVASLSQPVFADDWGCKVLLCLSNPSGPEAVSQCVPPIERLWNELRHGHPFPSCDTGSSSYANNTWSSGSYCTLSLVQLNPSAPTDPSSATCNAQGSIDVSVGGVLNTRVWWGVGGGASTTTLVETAAAGTLSYDPSLAVSVAVAAEVAREAAAAGGSGYAP